MKGQPIRVIEGTMKPFEPFWNFRNQLNANGEAEVEFFGVISEYSMFGDEVTPAKFKSDLYAKGGGGPVRMLVNSPGGDVFAANVVRAILQDYPGKVTADIVGLAASAATIVITGADQVVMREGTVMMIHNPLAMAIGYASDMRDMANVLDTIKETILNTYVSKTGKDRATLSDLMDKETWMAPVEAKDIGFVDEVVSGQKEKNGLMPVPTNMQAGFINCLKGYKSLPKSVEDLLPTTQSNEEPAPTQEPDPEPTPAPAPKELVQAEEENNESNVQPDEKSSGSTVDANALEGKRLSDYLEIFG